MKFMKESSFILSRLERSLFPLKHSLLLNIIDPLQWFYIEPLIKILNRSVVVLSSPRYRIGNIKNKSIDFSRLAQGMFAKDPFDDPECRKCKVLPLCGGGCPMDRLKYTEGSGKTPNYCSIYRERIEYLMPYMY